MRRTESYEQLEQMAEEAKSSRPRARRYPDVDRPRVRGQCESVARPCPFVSCKYNLYLDVTDKRGIRYTDPHVEPWDVQESCTLDVADRGGLVYEEIAEILCITKERIRQIELSGARKLKRLIAHSALPDRAGQICEYKVCAEYDVPDYAVEDTEGMQDGWT